MERSLRRKANVALRSFFPGQSRHKVAHEGTCKNLQDNFAEIEVLSYRSIIRRMTRGLRRRMAKEEKVKEESELTSEQTISKNWVHILIPNFWYNKVFFSFSTLHK